MINNYLMYPFTQRIYHIPHKEEYLCTCSCEYFQAFALRLYHHSTGHNMCMDNVYMSSLKTEK